MRPVLILLLALSLGSVGCDGEFPRSNVSRWEDLRHYPPADSLRILGQFGAPELRRVAVRAMGRIGDPRAADWLQNRLMHEGNDEVRAEAAFALGILGEKEVVPTLVDHLRNEHNRAVLGQVLLALGRLQATDHTAAVAEALQHAAVGVRERAAEALALLEDPAALPALRAAMDDPEESVAWRATYALEKIPSQEQVAWLIAATTDARRDVAYRAVARRSYAKQRLPADLFATGTAPRLVLVTCGGSFHDGVYSHNVVVYAEPA